MDYSILYIPVSVANNLTEFDSSVHHSGEVIEKVHGEERILQGHMNVTHTGPTSDTEVMSISVIKSD